MNGNGSLSKLFNLSNNNRLLQVPNLLGHLFDPLIVFKITQFVGL